MYKNFLFNYKVFYINELINIVLNLLIFLVNSSILKNLLKIKIYEKKCVCMNLNDLISICI